MQLLKQGSDLIKSKVQKLLMGSYSRSYIAFGVDVKDSVNSTDFGFNTGIGILIPITSKLNFFIESTGQSGFSSVDTEDNTSVKNSRGSLAIGVFF